MADAKPPMLLRSSYSSERTLSVMHVWQFSTLFPVYIKKLRFFWKIGRIKKREFILAKSILKMPNQCYCVLQLSEARSSQHNRSCDYNADNRTTLTFLENPAIAKQFCLRFWQLGVIMWCWAVGTLL